MMGKTWILLAVGSALVLAGCTGTGDDASTDAGELPDGVTLITIPEGTWDPGHDGPWYEADTFDIAVPGTVRILNADTVYHRIIGSFEAPYSGPAWLGTYSGGHDHAEEEAAHDHDEGGAAHDHGGSLVFDIDLDPGQWQDVVLEGEGAIAVHCHPHPWMVGSIHGVHAEPEPHAVTVNRLVVQGSASGTATMGAGGASADLPFALSAPNLASIAATLTWDDGEDDGPLGADANDADTFRFALVAPDGTTVAEDTVTARGGEVPLAFSAPIEWPETVEVRDHAEATALFDGLENRAASGVWIFRVELQSAPGYPGTGDGSQSQDLPVPGADGTQSWTLAFDAVHEWASLEGLPREDHATLEMGAGEAGHVH